MRCPFCSHEDSQVKDSRHTEDNTAIRRRRICDQCGSRFTTFERIQLRDLIVIKSNGHKETFDRDKMFRSLSLATYISGKSFKLESATINRNGSIVQDSGFSSPDS